MKAYFAAACLGASLFTMMLMVMSMSGCAECTSGECTGTRVCPTVVTDARECLAPGTSPAGICGGYFLANPGVNDTPCKCHQLYEEGGAAGPIGSRIPKFCGCS